MCAPPGRRRPGPRSSSSARSHRPTTRPPTTRPTADEDARERARGAAKAKGEVPSRPRPARAQRAARRPCCEAGRAHARPRCINHSISSRPHALTTPDLDPDRRIRTVPPPPTAPTRPVPTCLYYIHVHNSWTNCVHVVTSTDHTSRQGACRNRTTARTTAVVDVP